MSLFDFLRAVIYNGRQIKTREFMSVGNGLAATDNPSANSIDLALDPVYKAKIDAYPDDPDDLAAAQPTGVAFTRLLNFDVPKRMTVPNASGLVAFGLAANDVAAPGVEIFVEIPAGSISAGSLVVSTEMHLEGDCVVDADGVVTDFVATADYEMVCTRLTTHVACILRKFVAHNSTAPTVTSATIDTVGAPSSLVVVFSKRMIIESLTGLALTFSVGTQRNLVAVTAGNGTTTVTFSLSGAAAAGNAANFVVSGTPAAQDRSGNRLGTGSTATTFAVPGLASQAAWTRVWEGGRQMLPSSPGNVTSWTDQVGGSLQLVPASSGNAQTTTHPSISFSGAVGERLHAAVTLGTSFAIYVRARLDVGSPSSCHLFSFDDNASTNKRVMVGLATSGVIADCYDGTHNPQPTDGGWLTNNTYHDIFLEYDPAGSGTLTLSVDNRTPVPVTTVLTVNTLTQLTVGCAFFSPGEYQRLDGDIAAIGFKSGTASFTGPEKTAIKAYAAANL